MKTKISYLIASLAIVAMASCSDFLEVKPNKQLAVPNTLGDLEAILNNANLLNNINLGIGESCADNYYVTSAIWNTLPLEDKETYVWGDNIIPQTAPVTNAWQATYQAIYYVNSILEILDREFEGQRDKWVSTIKGRALFLRAFYYLALTNTWSVAYSEETADEAWGVPLRLGTDFNIASRKATVRECMSQVESDLKSAIPILPVYGDNLFSGSKVAAYALMSRLCMAKRKYDEAGLYADSCLMLKNELLDYGELEPSVSYPIPQFNKEVLFQFSGSTLVLLYGTLYGVDTTLYDSYQSDDFRKKLFFHANPDGSIAYRGSYNTSMTPFLGLALDEVYLNKIESLVRQSNIELATTTLNYYLSKRIKDYRHQSFGNQEDFLRYLLNERRKQLVFRDVRWMDLKRLNLEPSFQTTITRILNDAVYTLPPNDGRYALPLPENVRQFIE